MWLRVCVLMCMSACSLTLCVYFYVRVVVGELSCEFDELCVRVLVCMFACCLFASSMMFVCVCDCLCV